MKLGVVLSGGGAKGAYEAGFLKALSEFNIQPNAIAGTSIGALNGAVYSANKNTKEVALSLEKIWKDLANTKALSFIDKKKTFMTFVEIVTLFSPAAPVGRLARGISYLSSKGNNKSGALTSEPINNILENYASIEKLKNGLHFYVGLTQSNGNLIDALRLFELENNGLTEYKKIQDLKEEDIYKTILASAALPIFFDAQKIDGVEYRDGCLGSLNNEWGNTPAKPLIEKESCTHLIVCHLNEGSFFDRNDPIFKNTQIIEIRPSQDTFSKFWFSSLRFSVDKIDLWMNQGYEDSKRILSESFQALDGKYERIYYEQEAKKIDEKLKDFSWDD
ncbi:MAG: patatin-like phospholipase family protein [Arcobacter sp.]|jgi:NTE family protein|uniref:patatin-like phospholipase family protein n=1 Tax=Arcobacter sp. TaxID=1872629 RepID=UPI002A76279D|nr:patatin-like phospholipase family protein [Arcobacter sp.]MDY3205568.1 patatin-like phospholipase family protein [Arcobacter sp.]